ncbi:MAG: phage major capsid protein [Chloroflexota bacterium]|nr:phage major capsid protein [Chloroflexota bacterium]
MISTEEQVERYMKRCGELLDRPLFGGPELTKEEREEVDRLLKMVRDIQNAQSEGPVIGIMGILNDEGGIGGPYTFNGNKASTRAKVGASSGRAKDRTFKGMFPGVPLETNGFASFEEFLKVFDSGRSDPRLETKTMLEGTGASGGYMVPVQYGAFIFDRSLEQEIVRPRAQVWPMETNVRKVPAWDSNDHSGNLFGGFSGEWLAEGGTGTRQTPKLRQLELKAKKLAIYTQASREMVEDGVSFEDQLGRALIAATGWYMDYAFLRGSGAGEPLGVLNDPALVTVAKESEQTDETIVYLNCVKMFARLHPACVQNSVWLASSGTIPQLMTMSIETIADTAASFVPAIQRADGGLTLLTRPIIFTEKLPDLGNAGDLLLVDLSQYVIGLRKEIVLDKSNSPGWTEDLQDYRAVVRCDGQGSWNKAVTPANSGDSLSWCVALGARQS